MMIAGVPMIMNNKFLPTKYFKKPTPQYRYCTAPYSPNIPLLHISPFTALFTQML